LLIGALLLLAKLALHRATRKVDHYVKECPRSTISSTA
jgi:hypothetical protein